jgi:hypothetical protein
MIVTAFGVMRLRSISQSSARDGPGRRRGEASRS